MKKRIRTHLSNLAPDLAAKTVFFLYGRNQKCVLSVEQRLDIEYLLVDLIEHLGQAMESDEFLEQREGMVELAQRLLRQAGSLSAAVDSLQACRDIVLKQLSHDYTYFVFEQKQQAEFHQLHLVLYRLIDQLIAVLMKTPQQNDQDRPEQSVQSAMTNEHVDEPCPDVVAHGLMQIVVQSEDIGVLMIDRHLRIIEASTGLVKVLGIERRQMVGKDIDETFRPHDSERYIQWVVERGQSGNYLGTYNAHRVMITTSPIYEDGVLLGAIAVIRSINDNKHIEEELTKREALAAVGQLAAGMAHEIRNPLTSIKGFIQLLREQNKLPLNESYYTVILAEIERIDGLLNDVLVLARYRDNQMKPERFPLLEEICGVIRLLEPEAIRRGIRIDYELGCDSLYVYGHRARIKQAVLNILKNALEALATQGALIHISVIASINQAVVTVEDNGPGLTEDIRLNLFVPFYTTKPEGTGLGLSTTRRIITDHGGEIYADNSPKLGGARFEVRLPLDI